MKITVSEDEEKVHIALKADIDEKRAEILHQKLTGMKTIRELELDFSRVGYICSSGIGKLLLFYQNISRHGGRMMVTHLQPDLFRLFKELKLDTIFSISPDEFIRTA